MKPGTEKFVQLMVLVMSLSLLAAVVWDWMTR